LDEGPIIEREVIRIDHTYDPRALATVGQDAEALALSRAVRWHRERRVLLNGHSTVSSAEGVRRSGYRAYKDMSVRLQLVTLLPR
jgi:hypothetical protein